MRDFALVVSVIAFFGVCVAYVRACDRLIGREPLAETPDAHSEEPRPTVDSIG